MRGLQLISALALLVAAGCQRTPPPAEPITPPNIVLIVADDLGYGDLGSYGQRNIQTPRLDQFASEGIRFLDFYAGSTVCAPSRASLMTGLHTGHTPIRGNREIQPMGQHPLAAGTTTMASMLKQAGYATALIGKWGLGAPGSSGEPNQQGFDYFFGYLGQRHAHNYYPEFLFRNTERVPLNNEMPEPKRGDGAGYAVGRNDYSHDLIAQEAIDFAERSKNGPFFLLLTLTIPHANNEGKEKGMEVPDLGPYANKDWPEPQKGHAAMITRMDRDVGRLLDKLDELALADQTLVLFTSDNGPHREGGNDPDFNNSNGPLRGIKRDLYEGGIRVPLLARWPGRTPAGSVSEHVSAFWDFLPTFAEVAGVDAPAGIDGVSMAAALQGDEDAQTAHDSLYWEFHEGAGSKQAVRLGEWKGVRLNPSSPIELYNLDQDLGEEADVAADHPDVVEQIKAIFDAERTENEFWPLKG